MQDVVKEMKLQDLKVKSPTELLSFAEDRNGRDQRFYRLANEVPTVLMVGIVVLVVVKPF